MFRIRILSVTPHNRSSLELILDSFTASVTPADASTVWTWIALSANVVPATFTMGTTLDTEMKPGNRKGRPNYSVEFKLRLAAAGCEAGVSVSKLSMANGVNANMVFKWRREYRAGVLGDIYPIQTSLIRYRQRLLRNRQNAHLLVVRRTRCVLWGR